MQCFFIIFNFIIIALNYRCFTSLYLLGKIVEDSYIIFFFFNKHSFENTICIRLSNSKRFPTFSLDFT